MTRESRWAGEVISDMKKYSACKDFVVLWANRLKLFITTGMMI